MVEGAAEDVCILCVYWVVFNGGFAVTVVERDKHFSILRASGSMDIRERVKYDCEGSGSLVGTIFEYGVYDSD